MSLLKRLLLTFAFVALIAPTCFAANGFIISKINVVGLQRIDPGTVNHYLPVQVGQHFTADKGDLILTALYKTGFFSNVTLARRGNTLVIRVTERPTIGLIRVSGNKAISTKKLKPVLKSLGIVEGEVYDSVKLNEIKQGLQQEYAKLGYHAATVTTRVVLESRNRVAVYIGVNEGTIVTVRSIQIIGNNAFTRHALLNKFKLTTPGLLTWINHNDRYSAVKLETDLEALTKYYLNHGYLRFRIVSKQAKLTPDNRGVNILIQVSEGPLYHFGSFEVTGKTFGEQKKLSQLVTFRSGDVFSREEVLDSNKAVGNELANMGYAFANVSALPRVDDQSRLVHINFHITPGDRVYVRRINFFGNQRTNQSVLRHQMVQYEASAYSLNKVDESKIRLSLLPYFKDVTVEPQPVPGSNNQVDLNYHVTEVPAGKASIQGGYSDYYGFLYGASISEPNFLGSGKAVSLGFQNSEYTSNYSFGYSNPYYTKSGISFGYQIYYTHIKADPKFNLESYFSDGYGIDVTYGMPISLRNSLSFGYGFEHVAISKVNPIIAAPSVLNFLGIPANSTALASKNYNQFKLTGGWAYNGLNRYIFPTEGVYAGLALEVGVPVFNSSLAYYTATYAFRYYQPLFSGFILNFTSTIAYGNGYGKDSSFPFFKNFYVGGINSVPAFAPNSLGPKNRYNQLSAVGGNLETIFGAHLILPAWFGEKLRTAIVLDAGNVFQTPIFPGDVSVPSRNPGYENDLTTPQIVQDNHFSLGNLRPSLGLAVTWYSPMGPINLTLAFPLNKRPYDNTDAFQFSFGTSL